MRFRVLLLALLGAASLSGCAQLASEINLGSASANAKLQAIAAKIDTGIAVIDSDIPALCSLASNAAAVGAAAGSLSSSATLTKATAGAAATSSSAICTGSLTGTAADAATIAASIKQVSTAVDAPAIAIAASTAK